MAHLYLYRRTFWQMLVCVAWAPLACQRDGRSIREQGLRDMITQIVAPSYVKLVETSTALAQTIAALDGSTASVRVAQEAWLHCIGAWRQTYAFRQGPVVKSSALFRSAYWPIDKAKIDTLVASSLPIDAQAIEALGVAAKGLFAVEHLLFAERRAPEAGGEQIRHVQVMRALAFDVQGYAERLHAEVPLDGGAFATTFVSTLQRSLNGVVNDLIGTLESLVTERLNIVVGAHEAGTLAQHLIEGSRSNTSTTLLAAVFAGAKMLYAAPKGGIGGLVERVAPSIHARVDEQWAAIEQAIHELGDRSLHQWVTIDGSRLKTLTQAIRTLERMIKADVAAALGVTILFSAGDGD